MNENVSFPRVQVLPELDRASFRIDGVERFGYEFAPSHSRPFLFPVRGASGALLTRMGHPNPVGHEHHKSIWFGHQKVIPAGRAEGFNFWEEPRQNDIRVRHRRVTAYRDGQDWAGLSAELTWWAEGQAWLTQTLILAIEPTDDGFAIDLQSRFEAPSGPLVLGKTNFGFLGVRVAKTISEQFGEGRLRNAEGASGEPAIFGKTSRWIDYSGPSAPNLIEGIAYFDHPSNPRHPTPWHVRSDGWMEASFCMMEPFGIAKDHPLDLRYRLLVHSGPCDPSALNRAWTTFANLPPYEFVPAGREMIPTIRRVGSPA